MLIADHARLEAVRQRSARRRGPCVKTDVTSPNGDAVGDLHRLLGRVGACSTVTIGPNTSSCASVARRVLAVDHRRARRTGPGRRAPRRRSRRGRRRPARRSAASTSVVARRRVDHRADDGRRIGRVADRQRLDGGGQRVGERRRRRRARSRGRSRCTSGRRSPSPRPRSPSPPPRRRRPAARSRRSARPSRPAPGCRARSPPAPPRSPTAGRAGERDDVGLLDHGLAGRARPGDDVEDALGQVLARGSPRAAARSAIASDAGLSTTALP